MALSFDNALSLHPLALKLRDQRNELLAANLANADTPNYKAKDLDFQSILKGAQSPQLEMKVSQQKHLQPLEQPYSGHLQYRVPFQSSLDGNTVEAEQEQVRYTENNLRYQFSLEMINDDLKGLKTAIRGD